MVHKIPRRKYRCCNFLFSVRLRIDEKRNEESSFFRNVFQKAFLQNIFAGTPCHRNLAADKLRHYPPLYKSQYIRDLIIGFRDPVLWFIKSLLLLYTVFYLATIFIRKSKILPLIILWIGTIGVCIVSYYTNGDFGLNSISGIPLFAVGVVAALWSSNGSKRFHPALIPLVLSFGAISLLMWWHPRFIPNLVHLIADYSTIAAILIVFCNWSPSIKMPAVISLMTFDIYLVHYKVLTVMKEYEPPMSIVLFLVATALLSLSFYFLRTKLIKL